MPHIATGALKEYDWGAIDGLAEWTGSTGRPQAEVWFGTHPAGPTTVVDGPDAGRLLADLDEHQGMPLVKVLAAARPLSIQVHPDARTAQAGWERDPVLFADREEKSEMLMALTPFEIHAGWRDAGEAADALAEAGVAPDLVDLVRQGDYGAAIPRLIEAGAPHGLAEAARRAGWGADELLALSRVVDEFPADPGLAVVTLLRHDTLKPGEAIAVPAGVVHSYVSGIGVEVMTTSDNVLRLGLTSKAISVDDALRAIHPDRDGQRLSSGIGQSLSPAGMPFDLTLVDAPRDLLSGRHRVVLAWEADVLITSGAGAGLTIPRGRAGVWGPAEPDATVSPAGICIVATGDA
ncbi:MAG: mannose-6-phosphate isomerase, class [Actinomycetota bacterium]|jgi:mannose-6-phosphate isomerase